MAANIDLPELIIGGVRVDGEKYKADVKGNIRLYDCKVEETNLHLMDETKLRFDLSYCEDTVLIRSVNLITDGARFDVNGSVLLRENIESNLQLKGSQIDLAELIKYAPKSMLEEVGLINAEGLLNFSTDVQGMYSENELPQVNLNLEFLNGKISTRDYPELKNISFTAKASNGILRTNASTQLDVSSLNFETNKSKFGFVLSLLDIDRPKYDIKANMDLDLSEFTGFIPDSLLQHLEGKISADFATKGEMPDSINDAFIEYVLARSSADFRFSKFQVEMDSSLSVHDFSASLSYRPNRIKLDRLSVSVPAYHVNLKNTSFDLAYSGSIGKLNDMDFNLKAFHIENGKQTISGAAKFKNPDRPEFDVKTNIKLDLAELKPLLPDSLLNELSGEIYASIHSSGSINLDSVEVMAGDLFFKNTSVDLAFNKLALELFDDTLMRVNDFSADIAMRPDTIRIDKLGGYFHGIRFGLDSAKIANVYNTVLLNQKEQLYVQGNLSLGDIDYDLLSPFLPATDTLASDSLKLANTEVEQIDAPKEVAEPSNYSMLVKGKFSVNKVKYKNALIDGISAKFNLSDSTYIVDQFKFNAFGGTLNASMKYSLKKDSSTIVELRNNIHQMDVNKLLRDFDNFKDFYEPSITYDNISGLFSTELYGRFVLKGDTLYSPDMRVLGDIKLENGGVFNFEPVMELSKFTNLNELDSIQIKTLESKIFVFKNSIFVPKTNISSTALDVSAYGMQSLNDDFEYHLQIHLGDILLGKSKKLLEEQAKMGDLAGDSDRSAIYLIARNIGGKTKYGFDNKRDQFKMQTKIRVQEKMLQLIFHPQMVSFETDVK